MVRGSGIRALAAFFCRLDSGRDPVREWLKGLEQWDGMVLLHGFIKKTRKTPPQQIELAASRLRDWRSRARTKPASTDARKPRR